jgi:hypothetical protein
LFFEVMQQPYQQQVELYQQMFELKKQPFQHQLLLLLLRHQML